MEFGSAFNNTPVPPSLDERMANVADKLEALVAVLSGGHPLPLASTPAPMQAISAVDAVSAVQGLKGNATASEIADALAARLAPATTVSDGSGASVLAAVQEMTRILDHRLQGQRQAFGGGGGQLPGSVEVSNFPSPQVVGGAVSLLTTEFPWSAGDRARVDAVLAAIDTLEALTTDLRTEARRRPTYRLDSTSASVTTGAFVTVHTVTPAVATVVTGYNCDLNATGAFNYRQRLITGTDAAPTIATAEQLSTADNSWTQVALSVPAGTRIAVQVSHGEVTPQEFRASLAYYEEP